MRKIILILIVVMLSFAIGAHAKPVKLIKPSPAVELDDKLIQICNNVMADIYYDILAQKPDFIELSNFGEDAFYKNKHGIYTIVYDYVIEIPGPDGKIRKKNPFSIALTIDKVNDKTLELQRQPFAFGFPVLGIKFSGYQNKRLLRKQFDLLPLLAKYGTPLNDYQQEFLPLRLLVKPVKESFKVKEDIEFEVTLKNVSKANIVVKKLSAETLYFSYNGRVWGVDLLGEQVEKTLTRAEKNAARLAVRAARRKKAKARKNLNGPSGLLRAGEFITIILKGESFRKPQEVEIYSVYSVLTKSVNPTARMTVKIVK